METITLPMVLSAVGTAASFIGSMQQGDAQEEAARRQQAAAEESRRIAGKNAARIEAETQETVRREKLAAEEAQSLRKARAAAGGGTLTGSTAAFMEEQAGREADYIDWLKRSGASQADIERSRGQYSYLEGSAAADLTRSRAGQSRWDAFGSLLSGGTKLYDMYDPV